MPRLIHALANRTSLFHVGDLCLKRRALLRRAAKGHMPHGEIVLVIQVQLHGTALDHAFRLYHVPHTVNSRGGGDAANDPALIVDLLDFKQTPSLVHRLASLDRRQIHRITSGFFCSTGCVLAFPTAIAKATMPSIRPVACDLSGLRLPAGSMTATAFSAHISRTGCEPWRTMPASNRDSSDSSAGVMSLNPCPNSTRGSSTPMADSSRFSTSIRQRSNDTAFTGSSSHSSTSRSAT